jgi:hypothetical protein
MLVQMTQLVQKVVSHWKYVGIGGERARSMCTIREDMREESRYMQRHARARAAIKDIVEMPDMQIDRIVQAVELAFNATPRPASAPWRRSATRSERQTTGTGAADRPRLA